MLSPGSWKLRRNAGRAAVVIAATAVALGGLAGTALAHITVTPSTALQGATAELTFHVPNEEAKANVIEIQIQVPTAHPIAQFLVQPVPGWTVTVQNVKLAKPVVTDDGSFSTAVSEVTWSGGSIPPGEYQDFSVNADPLPSGVNQIAFKAIQTYSNGDIVRWIDLQQPGQPEPDHPAPVLTLTPASGSPTTTSETSASGRGGASRPAAQATSGSGDTPALALGIAGLAAGLLGLAAGLTAVLRRRRPAATGRDR